MFCPVAAALFLASGPVTAVEGNLQSGIDIWDSILQVGAALCIVLVLIVGGAWFMRRVGHFGNTVGRLMRVVGVLSVGSRERVVLIEVGGRQLLLGVAPGRVSTLHILEQTLSDASSDEIRPGFQDLIANLTGQNRKAGAKG